MRTRKSVIPLRLLPYYMSETTIQYYKYNEHKHLLIVVRTSRFTTGTLIHIMRCVRCDRDFVWKVQE
jgi:hypothetical protein